MAAKPKKSVPFAAVVRAAVTAHQPRYKALRTTKGSGPVLYYRAPRVHPRLEQEVFFQKGLYSNWLRASYTIAFVGKRGKRHELGQLSLPELSYATADELAAKLVRLLPRLDKAVAAQRRRAEPLAPNMTKLLDGLPAHVSAWMTAEGGALRESAWAYDSFGHPAFRAFERWLRRARLPVAAAGLAVWDYWTDAYDSLAARARRR